MVTENSTRPYLLLLSYSLILIALLCVSSGNGQGPGNAFLPRQERVESRHPVCGAAMVRVNLDLEKLYGFWYPVEVSEEAYNLWITSLFGNEHQPKEIVCPRWEFQPALIPTIEYSSMDVKISLGADGETKMMIEAVLLGDKSHPGYSKWVMSWPTGENTLTSIVATGSLLENNSTVYDWLLTMDCDVDGDESPDWAIFSRHKELNKNVLLALKAVVEGINGLDPENSKVIGNTCNEQ